MSPPFRFASKSQRTLWPSAGARVLVILWLLPVPPLILGSLAWWAIRWRRPPVLR